jgi:hypothetical protein
VAWLLLKQPSMTTFVLPPPEGLPLTATFLPIRAEVILGCLAAIAIVWVFTIVVMVARDPWNTVVSRKRRMSAPGRAPRPTVTPAVAGGGVR